jgi:hypothetical protein
MICPRGSRSTLGSGSADRVHPAAGPTGNTYPKLRRLKVLASFLQGLTPPLRQYASCRKGAR